MFTYRKILAKAWELTRKNPVLWIFGLFVALLGTGGEIEIISSSATFGSGLGVTRSLIAGVTEGALFNNIRSGGILEILKTKPVALLLFVLFAMILLAAIVFFVWLINVCQASLLNGLVEGVKSKTTSGLKNFSFGVSKFWPVFSFNFFSKAITALLFIAASLFALVSFPGSLYIFTAVFIVFTAVIVLISFIVRYATCAVVLRGQKLSQALSFGKELFLKNWLLSLEVALILFAIYFLVNYIFAFIAAIVLFYAFSAFRLVFSAILITVILTGAVFIFIQMILAVFHWAVWVLVFEIISSKKAVFTSRLINVFKKIFG